MKRLLLLGCLLSLVTSLADAQRIRLFRSIIYTAQGQRIDGILYDMTDSTVRCISNEFAAIEQIRVGQPPTVFDIHYATIERIVIRRKRHVGRGITIGTGLGLIYSLGIVVFTRPDYGQGIGALSDVVRSALIVAGPIGGAIYGGLFSIIPYKVIYVRQNRAAYKTAKAQLKWLSVGAQQRVSLSVSVSDSLLQQHP